MDALSLFGLATVSCMLIFYALEDRSTWCILAFAGACGLASIYGFLQGGMAVWHRRSNMVRNRRATLANSDATIKVAHYPRRISDRPIFEPTR